MSEPPPSVLAHRPDCPLRLDLAIQRAMAKDPADRFASMDELCDELEACLAEVEGRDGEGATMIVPPPPRPRRERRQRERRPFPVGILLIVLFAALLVAGGAYLLSHGGAPGPLARHKAAASVPVHLQGVGAYDPPPGDNREHDGDAKLATDGNSSSAWSTEEYQSFTKPGVGLVLRAPQPKALARVVVDSVGSDFDAQIKAGDSPTGPFTVVSGGFQPVGPAKTFAVDTHGKNYRYYVVWLKLPFDGGQARISEVRART